MSRNDGTSEAGITNFQPAGLPSTRTGLVLNALRAEGVPSSIGYDRPLYRNPLFTERAQPGPAGCPLSCPYYGGVPDYTTVQCPVCEEVVRDTVWLFHTLLLADESAMQAIVTAIRKVIDHSATVREIATDHA